MQTYLAIDIGASSGRHILSWVEDGRIRLEEIYRFENGLVSQNGHLCWDVQKLWNSILTGMKVLGERGNIPVSLGIDTWAVDYVLLDEKGHVLGDTMGYRDKRTEGMDKRLERTMSFRELYTHTGVAKQPFNTVYQLMAADPAQLNRADAFLMIPDYFYFLLTGKRVNEYTNASTTALMNAADRCWDKAVLRAAGIPEKLFSSKPQMPGTVVGELLANIAKQVGYSCKVVLPATHDTGSAFLAVPAQDESAIYLSSGTWSLLGVENDVPITSEESIAAGFTNEGGYNGKIRYLKNIMGLWILQCIHKETENRYTFSEMAEMAMRGSGYPSLIDVNDRRFLAPESMMDEIKASLKAAGHPEPQSLSNLLYCVYRSLAVCYRDAIHQLRALTGKNYTSINIIGGGSQNATLNQMTADMTGLPVFAGPKEGTALGNAIAQMLANGEFENIAEARKAIKNSFPIKSYDPYDGKGLQDEHFI